MLARPLRPVPSPSLRPWGGRRLGGDARVGELWLAGPDSTVELDGAAATLDEVSAALGAAFVGRRALALLGARFPLLVKVIDAADWLSLQVHPDDALARSLYGPAAVGKTEAWLVLEADADATLVTGPSLPAAETAAAVAAGSIGREACEVRAAVAGDAYLVRAGTLHAIGAGTFVYEIEQPSDYTFRVSDWGRPQAPGRGLHVEEAALALVPTAHAELRGAGFVLDGGALEVRELRLEIIAGPGAATRRPEGASLEVITAVRGDLVVRGEGWLERLRPLETLVVPAAIAAYEIEPGPGALACVGLVPEQAPQA